MSFEQLVEIAVSDYDMSERVAKGFTFDELVAALNEIEYRNSCK